MSNRIKEELEKYDIKKISKELDIPTSTLYRWIRGENINSIKKYIELLYYLNIDPKEIIEKK